jgi:hypothetical protein
VTEVLQYLGSELIQTFIKAPGKTTLPKEVWGLPPRIADQVIPRRCVVGFMP